MDLDGAIDLHVHTAPDVYERSVDDAQLVRRAAEAGMRGVLLKSHHTLTADRAALARAHAPGLEVFGGIALNHAVGGLNPVAVEAALALGAKQIWMPTLHAAHCLAHADAPMFRAEAKAGRPGIGVLDGGGALVPELGAILEMARDAGVVVGSGHLAPAETVAVFRAARELGISRLLVTHPVMSFVGFSRRRMREVTELGATLELDYLSCCPGWHGAVDPDVTAAAIRTVGAGRCVLASDGGQPFNPSPPEMLRAFGRTLRERGVAEDELRCMTRDNPARLLDL